MLEARSGAQVGPIVTGTANRTVITQHVKAQEAGLQYVQLHTHPSERSFSDADVLVFVERRRFAVMTVIGANGTSFLLSRVPGGVTAPAALVGVRARTVARALRARYRRLAANGLITADAAARELSHDLWQTVPQETGLRYDRVEPGQRRVP
jgi:hypothetical protein